MMYTTLDGRVLELSGLSEDERVFLDRCVAAYRDGTAWEALSRLVEGVENPLVRAEGGRITRTVWDHPLFHAVSDLEDRLTRVSSAPQCFRDHTARRSRSARDELVDPGDTCLGRAHPRARIRYSTTPGIAAPARRGSVDG